MKKYIIFIIFILLFSCGKWKTTKLKSDILCTINPGDLPGEVMLKYDDDEILDISFKIKVHKNNLYVADNFLKRLQVLDKSCEPSLYIGEKKSTQDENGLKFSKFQFSIIEEMAVDSNGNIYVQNRFASPNKDLGLSPSYILVFDNKGTLLYTLGKNGSPDIPFNSIEGLAIDRKDRLFVIMRSFDMWSVMRFTNKKRDFSVNFSENEFKDVDGEDTFSGKIEKIISYQSGDDLLVSVAYYNAADFKYRKIFSYSTVMEKISNTTFIIPDPKNELFAMVDDKNIFLWDTDEKNARFMICNLKGDIINNISIKTSEIVNSLNEILLDNSGNFYSYHVSRKEVEVLEWR